MRLEVNNLHKSFEQAEVLHGISFAIESGKALGLLGRNGAGKTTTIRILMDVFKANEGSITIDGKPFIPSDFNIGYLPEERGLYPKKKVSDQLVYLGMLRGMTRKDALISMRKWLKKLGVEEYENRRLDTLSKGNQQKIQLAQTLIQEPQIIILDEPFSGLDPVNSQILKDVVLECIQDQRLVIFSSHQMNYVEEFCEEIAILNKGEVVLAGNLNDIKKDFGNHRIEVLFEDINEIETKTICETLFKEYVEVDQLKPRAVVLKLLEGKSKQSFLKALISKNLIVSKFANYEPNLTDIFVAKAGDEA
ncbi:MAG: ATP-binding cassette domain-containing protein [Erysipelotrichaceae bacterium]